MICGLEINVYQWRWFDQDAFLEWTLFLVFGFFSFSSFPGHVFPTSVQKVYSTIGGEFRHFHLFPSRPIPSRSQNTGKNGGKDSFFHLVRCVKGLIIFPAPRWFFFVVLCPSSPSLWLPRRNIPGETPCLPWKIRGGPNASPRIRFSLSGSFGRFPPNAWLYLFVPGNRDRTVFPDIHFGASSPSQKKNSFPGGANCLNQHIFPCCFFNFPIKVLFSEFFLNATSSSFCL